MKLDLPQFPVLIDRDIVAALHAESRAAATAYMTQAEEYQDLQETELARLIDLEVGQGFDPLSKAPFAAEQIERVYAATLIVAEPFHPTLYLNHRPETEAWLKEAGAALHSAGGIEAMCAMYYAVRAMGGGISTWLSRAWDGVGDWRH